MPGQFRPPNQAVRGVEGSAAEAQHGQILGRMYFHCQDRGGDPRTVVGDEEGNTGFCDLTGDVAGGHCKALITTEQESRPLRIEVDPAFHLRPFADRNHATADRLRVLLKRAGCRHGAIMHRVCDDAPDARRDAAEVRPLLRSPV